MDANYALQTNISSELRNSHQIEKFPTAANYTSEPGYIFNLPPWCILCCIISGKIRTCERALSDFTSKTSK